MKKILTIWKKTTDYLKNKHNFKFKHKPILLGGGAYEHYKLRKTGSDLDVMISNEDKERIKKLGGGRYELNLFGGKTEKDVDSSFTNFAELDIDLMITVNQYGYDFFVERAIHGPTHDLLVMGIEDLLMTKVFAVKYQTEQFPDDLIRIKKHEKDVELSILGIEVKQGYKDLSSLPLYKKSASRCTSTSSSLGSGKSTPKKRINTRKGKCKKRKTTRKRKKNGIYSIF